MDASDPKPKARRYRRWTPELRQKFLDLLGAGTSISGATKLLCVSRRWAQTLYSRDPVFAAAWRKAFAEGTAALEDEALRRAVEGTEQPIYYAGQLVGSTRVYSDRLLMFLLKARRPEKYRERRGTHSSSSNLRVPVTQTRRARLPIPQPQRASRI